MKEIALIAITAFSCICSFIIGVRVRQKVDNHEEVKMPSMNPIKVLNEVQDNRRVQKEIERNRIIAENIDNYDGTGLGQKEVPK